MFRASASDRDEVAKKTSHQIVDNPCDDWRSCYRSFYLLSLLEPDTGAEWQRLCLFATLNSRYGNCPGPTAKHFHAYPDSVPEGDTIFRTAATLREALVGKTLTRCDVRVPRYATTDLTGHTVDEVLSRGKHLFIRVGPASIHSHLKMDGSWRISPRGVPDHKIRILLRARGTTAAGIDLGTLEILERDHDMDAVAHLGPDLLGDDWDPDHAAANLIADPDRALAEALLDQRVMAGVGNVYCNELCFVFGRLPTSPVAALPDPLRLVARARDMLWANRARQNRTTTGDTRRGSELWVYGREGRPCRRCGTPIARSAPQPADRVSYWCPSCQR